MPIDTQRVRELLRQLDLKRLFVEELNWANPHRPKLTIDHAGHKYRLTPQAEQGGLVVFSVETPSGDGLPDRSARLAIHRQLLDRAQEHILVFLNEPRTASLWMWVEREGGRRKNVYEHRHHISQPGDSLLQKLQGLAFDWHDLDEEGRASIVEVTDRVRASLATEKVTKKFYDEFKRQHDAFLGFISGIDQVRDAEWYASIMLNRLMFIYFIQKKGFLGGDTGYLGTRLADCRMQGLPYYRGFLTTLFFRGFACRPEERTQQERELLGEVPYLNGGLFLKHQVEEANEGIDIPDEAFESLFAFFDRYQWHLDDRPLRNDREINPDVLGYIFEKYINQKQMGAYYTREDITEYITKNTLIPFIFDRMKSLRNQAVDPLPIADIEPYIHDAVKKGVDLDLPAHIAAGLDDVSQRGDWNRAADEDFALPTETWREHVARRARYRRILDDFGAGKITAINDFITYNLDIIKYADDFISETQDPLVVNAFYFHCLKTVTVLDPTCGSGAFLFAALSILEPLYERCLQRMEEFLAQRKRHPQWAQPFEEELARLARHPSRRYFIYKSIIVGNLYGVDIMEEAVEICKLRLFLKLVAQVEDGSQIEPLPDIDFNIRAGNTLVGYASLEEIEGAKVGRFDFGGVLDRVKAVDRSVTHFRKLQMEEGFSAQHFREAKQNLLDELGALEAELNEDLRVEYGAKDLEAFVASHKPFHWYVEFYDIMAHGGFDVIVGNPPYVEYSKVRKEYTIRGYETEGCGNLYGYCMERSVGLLREYGRFGMIVPVASVGLDKTTDLRRRMGEALSPFWISSYAIRPSKLFQGVDHRLSVQLGAKAPRGRRELFATAYQRWHWEERETLFQQLTHADVGGLSLVGRPAKVSDGLGLAVVRKVSTSGPACHAYLQKDGGSLLHYHRSPRYWIRAMDFEPRFRSATRTRSVHHFRDVWFVDQAMARFVGCMLNSNLFYFWFAVFGNGRNIAASDIANLPVGTPSGSLMARTEALFSVLMDDYNRNSRRTVREDCEYQEFDAAASKPIIDEIDRVLAEHYGFTDEELDFIINYDIKYRMGGAEEGPDDGE